MVKSCCLVQWIVQRKGDTLVGRVECKQGHTSRVAILLPKKQQYELELTPNDME